MVVTKATHTDPYAIGMHEEAIAPRLEPDRLSRLPRKSPTGQAHYVPGISPPMTVTGTRPGPWVAGASRRGNAEGIVGFTSNGGGVWERRRTLRLRRLGRPG